MRMTTLIVAVIACKDDDGVTSIDRNEGFGKHQIQVPSRRQGLPRKRLFITDAGRILFGADGGGRYITARDPGGWFRYVFLDIDRHPFECRYVRFLRCVRRLGVWPPA